MKKPIVLLFILLLYPVQKAFSQIEIRGTFEDGYENRELRIVDDTLMIAYQSIWLKNVLFVGAGLNVNYKGFSVHSNNRLFFNPEKLLKYKFLQFEYSIGVDYRNSKIDFLSLSAEHMRSNSIGSNAVHEAYDRIYFKLDTLKLRINPQIKVYSISEFGYENRSLKIYDSVTDLGSSLDWLKNVLFTNIPLIFIYKGLSLYGNIKTYFRPEKLFKYNPLQSEYGIGISYETNGVLFSLEHLCSHSIESRVFYNVYDLVSIKIDF